MHPNSILQVSGNRITVGADIYLSPTTSSDRSGFVKYLNDREIYKTTLRIPFPYTESDADFFLGLIEQNRQQFSCDMNWSIRDSVGEMIGGIGLHGFYGPGSHKDELGYWLARPYWGRGIMTRVVGRFSQYLFEEQKMIRIEATVFEGNTASCRVLEKCGYELEGTLRKCYLKDGNVLDGKLYALVR